MSWLLRLFRPGRAASHIRRDARPPDTGEPVFLAAPPPRPLRRAPRRQALSLPLPFAPGCR